MYPNFNLHINGLHYFHLIILLFAFSSQNKFRIFMHPIFTSFFFIYTNSTSQIMIARLSVKVYH